MEVELRHPAGTAARHGPDRRLRRHQGNPRRQQRRELQSGPPSLEHEHSGAPALSRSSTTRRRRNLGVQAMGNIRYIDSYGESFYHGLQVKAGQALRARPRLRRGLHVQQVPRRRRKRRSGRASVPESARPPGLIAACSASTRPTTSLPIMSGNCPAQGLPGSAEVHHRRMADQRYHLAP